MGQTARKPVSLFDELMADKAVDAKALAKKLGKKGFKFVRPPFNLNEKAKPLSIPNFNPVEAAENHLKKLSVGFKFWMQEDLEKLQKASTAFQKNPDSRKNFDDLSSCIHTIKGNASILDYEAAGMIACPLTDLMENCFQQSRTRSILLLAVNAICKAVELNTPADDPELLDTISMLNNLNTRCAADRQKVPDMDYAAGKASCFACSKA